MGIDGNQVNYARVLQVLRENGSASRLVISRKTGLSPATVTSIVRDLIEKRYVHSSGIRRSGAGRPSEILEYDALARLAIGIDLHDHSLLGVVTDLYARPIFTEIVEPVMDGAEAITAAVRAWIQQVQPRFADKECVAIGVAIPGWVDPISGVVGLSTEFNLSQFPIVDQLAPGLSSRPIAINRTYAVALAESWLGIAKEAKNVVYVRIGDNIGGAILIDGLPYWGSKSGAGSIAHMYVDPRGLPCRCGGRGCLDTVASGNAIVRRAREEIRKGRTSILMERTDGNLDRITGLMVVEEAKSGDLLSRDVLREAGEWLGIAISNSINLLGPDMVVIGGTLGRAAGNDLVDRVCETTRLYVYPLHMRGLRIAHTILGDDAVACGAAATALWTNLTQSINLHVG